MRRPQPRTTIALALVALALALPVPGLWVYQGPPMEEGFMLAFPQRILAGEFAKHGYSAAIVDARLQALGDRLKASRASDPVQRDHDRWLGGLIGNRDRLNQLLQDRHHAAPTPPGSPIGAESNWHG